MQPKACAKCGADAVMGGMRIMDRGHYSGDSGKDLSVVVERDPSALLFKRAQSVELFADVCGRCGFAEMYVRDPELLYRAWEEARAGREQAR